MHSRLIKDPTTDQWDVLSADFKIVLSSHPDFQEAIKALESEMRKEKIACPTGGCDD